VTQSTKVEVTDPAQQAPLPQPTPITPHQQESGLSGANVNGAAPLDAPTPTGAVGAGLGAAAGAVAGAAAGILGGPVGMAAGAVTGGALGGAAGGASASTTPGENATAEDAHPQSSGARP
jgi:phage tail tape-measure protein